MNRYIKAMEIGNAYEKEGITYYELKDKLRIEFDVNSETTFVKWFMKYFDTAIDYTIRTPINTSYLNELTYQFILKNHNCEGRFQIIQKTLESKSFLTGEASKQYLEYIELKESRESSKLAIEKAEESIKLAKKSTNLARWALIIAIITSVISIVFSIAEFNK
ncbi:hypothetical protein [Sinomicrobium sp. M5D2P17]